MPSPVDQPYPIPSSFFGDTIRNMLLQINLDSGLVRDYITIQQPKPLINGTAGTTGLMSILQSNLLPGSTVKLIVESTPIVIGEFTVDQSGIVSAELNLPLDLEPGIHELHLEGFDIYGEKIDYYEIFIVGAAQGDFDGDGIENETDSCVTIQNSLIDNDSDGIDDACDGVVLIPEVEDPDPEEKEHILCTVLENVSLKLSQKNQDHQLKFLDRNKKYTDDCS